MLENLKENKKAIIILILLLISLSVGISYAYWRLTLQQTGENKIASSCLSIELIDESESIKMENAYPIIDEETNANENDSDIKKYLDSWYKQNIEAKGLSEYIADAGFCNDRSLSTRANNGDGVQTTGKTTSYAGYTRYYETHAPILTCPNPTNDLFTTSTSNIGNKALTYPIGLITVDELMLGGLSDGYLNRLSYTYSSYSYWTMSPRYFNVTNTSAHEFSTSSAGYASNDWVTSSFGVRAVINLKGNVKISGGIGSANDPFAVKTI